MVFGFLTDGVVLIAAVEFLVVATLLDVVVTETNSLVLAGVAFKLEPLVVDTESDICVFVMEVDVFITDAFVADVFVTDIDVIIGVPTFVTDIDNFVTAADGFVSDTDVDCDCTRVTLGTDSDIEATFTKDTKADVSPVVLVVVKVEAGQWVSTDETELCKMLKLVLTETSGEEIKLVDILELRDTGEAKKL